MCMYSCVYNTYKRVCVKFICSMYVLVFVCMQACMYVGTHACTHMKYLQTHTHTCTHKYIDIYIYKYTQTYIIHANVQSCRHTYTKTLREFLKKKQVLLGIQRGTLIFGTSHLYPQGIQSLCRRGCCKLPYLWLRGPRRTSLWQSW